jgi:hypothetical protein
MSGKHSAANEPRRRLRAGLWVGLVALTLAAFVGAAPAAAKPNAPGNNGTLKVHEDQEPSPEIKNQPHVCTFHLHGFHFDDNSSGSWWIKSWPPTGDRSVVKSGGFSADGTGEWRTAQMSLPNGHYKAYAKQENEPTPGGDKQKVFWVRCAATTTTASATSAPATTAAPGTTAAMPSTSAASPTTMAATSSSQAPTSTSAEAASATLTSTPSTQAGGGLPFTGTPAMTLLVAALALLAVGASTLFGFRRRASQR